MLFRSKLREEYAKLTAEIRKTDSRGSSSKKFKELQAEISKLKGEIDGLTDKLIETDRQLKQSSTNAAKFGTSIKGAFALIGGGAVVKSFISQMISARSQMESIEKSYEVLLGSQEKSKQMLDEIKQYAIISPLEMTDLTSASKTLLGFGIEAEKVMPTLKQLGDIAMGDSGRFGSLSLAFAQVSAAGKLMGQDLNQMINAGFNPLEQMAKDTGKSIGQLKDEMSKGAISAQMVADAIKNVTSEGGKFYGMTEKAADTIQSAQSNFTNAITEAFNEMGKSSEGAIKGMYNSATAVVQNYDKIGKALVALCATVGTYKGLLIATSILEGDIAIKQKLATTLGVVRKAQLALNATIMANPYVALTAAVVGLTVALVSYSNTSTSAEKAQKRFNDRLEEQKKATEEYSRKASSLIDNIKDVTSAEIEKSRALEALKNMYPDIFSKYDLENVKLADKLNLLKLINEENVKNNLESDKSNIDNLKNEIKNLENSYNSDSTSGTAKRALLPKIENLKTELKLFENEYSKSLSEIFKAEFDAKPAEEKIKYFTDKLAEATQKRNELIRENNYLNTFDPKFVENKILIDGLAKQEKKYQSQLAGLQPTSSVSYSEALENAKKQWQKDKNVFAKISLDKAKFTEEDYLNAKKALEASEKAYKDLGSATSLSVEKETEKISQSEITGRAKQIEEYTRAVSGQIQESELELRASRIEIDRKSVV